ncbi:DNA excision repair protein ERCC-6-like [Montipora foliosa]|uniref:DNA excision repair protein ERCC-6-like n=1 Tax=Montipora foliosa TaxID=591990 RepID=UPI0035F1240A
MVEVEETTKSLTRLSISHDPELSSVQDELKAKFNTLISKAKELSRQGNLEKALGLLEKAYTIRQSEKLQKKIEKLKEVIQKYKEEETENDDDDDEEGDQTWEVGDGFFLPAEMYKLLYPYQLEGIRWFWRLYKQSKGGILGDDMGLGKTVQVVTFLAGMFDAGLIKSALIVMPVSLLTNWEKEFNKWAPGIRVKLFHGSNKTEREKNLRKVQKKHGVCLTTYGLVVTCYENLGTTSNGNEFKWDYIILDEGHKIKNTTKTSKNIRLIPAKNHFILTGTPIQNNLREMWSLFDFVCEGKLLGTSRTFKQEYENPIIRARERDASAYEKRIGMEMSESLRKLIAPHFLRRTKAMVLESKKENTDETDNSTQSDDKKNSDVQARAPEQLTRKNDFIVWLCMSDTQQKIYGDFLTLERVKELLMSNRSPLVELNVLKHICDHPRLLSTLACEQLGLDEEDRLANLGSSSSADDDDEGSSFASQPKGRGVSETVLTQESCKMIFLVALLDNLKSEGHRCLVFSQSRKMLDIIQRVITHRGHKVLRIDGTVSKTDERQHLITTFQTDPTYSCFLLTTQVGGVGITLTAADRVVIFDPSWNPATDAQAVDRVYRIGQKKTVIIYRLITCGTLEEKIYRKQIFKVALMKQTTGVSKNPFRYFSRQELRDLFTLDDPYTSKTQMQLEQMHAQHRKTDEELNKHIAFLYSLDIFGISDHDLMYSQEAVDATELNTSPEKEAIQARVVRAQNLMAAEAKALKQLQPTDSNFHAKGLHQMMPISRENMSAKQKIQAKIDCEKYFIPQKQDTTRFQPGNSVKIPVPIHVPAGCVAEKSFKTPAPIHITEVVNLCTPSPVKTSPPIEIKPSLCSSPTAPDSHVSLAELEALNAEPEAEDSLETEFALLQIGKQDSSSSGLTTLADDLGNTYSCCPRRIHVSKNVNILKCECLMSHDELELYDTLVKNGRQLEEEGNTTEAVSKYIDALDLKSSDLQLQLKVLLLMRDVIDSSSFKMWQNIEL